MDTIVTNLRCSSCGVSLSPTSKEYQEGFKCRCGTFIHAERLVPRFAESIDKLISAVDKAEKCKHGFVACKECNFNWPQEPKADSTNPKDKFGAKKVPLGLVPSSALARLAMVMQLGAKKYGPYNWRQKEVRLTIYLDAAERHLRAILDGQDLDEESGQLHAAHVMACMAIVIDAVELNKLVDDRPSPGNFAELIKRLESK